MKSMSERVSGLTVKVIAVLLIILCFAVGAVGLILPIIPGLLLIAIALMLVAKFFPALDRQLRQNRTLRSYLDGADGFASLSWTGKLQYGCLLTLKLFVDAVAFCVYVFARLLSVMVVKYQSYR